jgi:hypothetical protein
MGITPMGLRTRTVIDQTSPHHPSHCSRPSRVGFHYQRDHDHASWGDLVTSPSLSILVWDTTGALEGAINPMHISCRLAAHSVQGAPRSAPCFATSEHSAIYPDHVVIKGFSSVFFGVESKAVAVTAPSQHLLIEAMGRVLCGHCLCLPHMILPVLQNAHLCPIFST